MKTQMSKANLQAEIVILCHRMLCSLLKVKQVCSSSIFSTESSKILFQNTVL